ncbi:unnamed protein product [Larinioides sclopetarius]|uniref:Uncharacterized protein n=1 Tax=Larinioides sclopetarius TaxID=280406 RepID=A0AAV2BT72_9ARAC
MPDWDLGYRRGLALIQMQLGIFNPSAHQLTDQGNFLLLKDFQMLQ